MKFVHEDRDFVDLLGIVAHAGRITAALVEKDYWVTHVLWALQRQGFELWFKGGTSLSKGFGLIHRFSEDLDLKVDPGSVSGIASVTQWRSAAPAATQQRQRHFLALAQSLAIPFATTWYDAAVDPTFRSASIQVRYPGHLLADLGKDLRPFVLLEIGDARVVPCVQVDLSSFVHDHLSAHGLASAYADNRPRSLRCVHPLVTLLEKLDAIHRRFTRGADPATFVRHYEDAACVIANWRSLPAPAGYSDVRDLAADMLRHRQLSVLPTAADRAFLPDASSQWLAVKSAHAAIAPMFWGPRVSLAHACMAIRGWTANLQ